MSSFEQQRRSTRHEMRIIDAVLEHMPSAASNIEDISKSIRPIIQVRCTSMVLCPVCVSNHVHLVINEVCVSSGLGASRAPNPRLDIQSSQEKHAFLECRA